MLVNSKTEHIITGTLEDTGKYLFAYFLPPTVKGWITGTIKRADPNNER